MEILKAAEEGLVDVVQEMLTTGANMDEMNSNGLTALQLAACKGVYWQQKQRYMKIRQMKR